MSEEIGVLSLESSAFENHQVIPKAFSCQGKDISPPLTIQSARVKDGISFAIIMEDPDAPSGVFDHWLGWNIPANKTSWPEGMKAPVEGMNGFGKIGYRGPCPPPGKSHRYYFKVFLLDQMLTLPKGSSKPELIQAMNGHILGSGELIGTFQR